MHVILLQGSATVVARAEKLIADATDCIRLCPKMWLIASDVLYARDWRDHLALAVPGLELLVVNLDHGWATQGRPDVAEWIGSHPSPPGTGSPRLVRFGQMLICMVGLLVVGWTLDHWLPSWGLAIGVALAIILLVSSRVRR